MTRSEHAMAWQADLTQTIRAAMKRPLRLKTKVGLHTFDQAMTESQAKTWGEHNMPKDLKRAGFWVSIFRATFDINGWIGYRINYVYGVRK